VTLGLDGVSCASSSFCMAVSSENSRWLTYNGNAWSSPMMLSGAGNGLKSVSCPSATFCAGVDGMADALTWHG